METSNALSARSLQYYAITRQWASDLEFFRIETAFLHRLMDDYFIRLNAGHPDELRQIREALSELEKDKSRADQLLHEQLRELELMAEDVIPEDTEQLVGKQINLENLIAGIVKEYRNVKRKLFSQVEQVMRTKINA